MFNHMIGNITKIRLRSYICASSDVFLPSISSLSCAEISNMKKLFYPLSSLQLLQVSPKLIYEGGSITFPEIFCRMFELLESDQ